MAMTPIRLPPGLRPAATSQDTGQAWWDMNLVRWSGNTMQPVGGWLQLTNFQLNDAVRNILSWRTNGGERWVAASSLSQVQLWDGAQGYDITATGFVAGVPGDLIDGYGIGKFGVGQYGTPRIPDVVFDPLGAPGDTISLDNWGEFLVVCGSADGRLLWWQPNSGTGTKLAVIPPATPLPTESAGIVHVVPPARYAFVTDERFLVALGANHDPRQVAWSDQERPGAWTPDIANLCGSLELHTTGMALAARRVPQGYVIWCDDDVHLMSWVGPPYAYGIERVGTGCSAISPNAMIATSARSAWMGQECFWLWEGVPIPLRCDIQSQVFNNINRDTQGRVVACQNGRFPEFWWFYPDATSKEPNRYAVWNYQANIWYGGYLSRTGCTEPAAYGLPLAGDANGYVYGHENGWTANGVDRGSTVWAESGDLMMGAGDRGLVIRAIIPDAGNLSQSQIHLLGRWQAQDAWEDWGVFPYVRTDGIIDAMVEGRIIKLRIEGATQPNVAQIQPWTLGRIAFDTVPGSGR